MAADIEKIKERIRKMLRLAADDGAAEGEIQTALEGAQYLLMKHQLSEDDLEALPEDLRTPEQVARDTEYGTAKSWAECARAPGWYGQLAMVIADFIGTVKVYHDHPKQYRKPSGIVANDGKPVTGWVFYGPHDDCILASELHGELLLTCAATAKLKFGGALVSGAGRDYCDGFVTGLRENINVSKMAAKQATARIAEQVQPESRALSVVDVNRAGAIAIAKKQAASEWLKSEHGINLKSSSGSRRSIGDGNAYGEGKADGRSQTLTKTRTMKIGQR